MRPLLLLALLSAPAWSACNAPSTPAVPDGATSTKEQMIQAQGEVKVYIAAANEYLACVDKDIQATEDAEQKAALNASYNAVVDQMTAVGGQFNAAIKAYKAQGG